MPPNVKGFLKGLKYIQNIFENPKEEEEKEEELQIGLPTDVKHVAHIGSDGPSSNAPSWMTEFNSSQLTSPPALPVGEDDDRGNIPTRDSLLKNKKETETSPRSPLSAGHGPPLGSPPKKSTKKHHLRRNHAPKEPSDTGTPESPKAPSKHGRRKKKSADASSNEAPPASKPSHRKRSSKSSSGSGSSTSSRPKSGDSFDEVVTTDLGLGSESGHGPNNSKIEPSKMKDGSKEGNRWGKIQEKTRLLLKSETKAVISR